MPDTEATPDADETAGLTVEHYRLALAAGLMGTWDWDLATDDLTWDERQFQLFGIRREDFTGRGSQALAAIHAEDRPRVDAAIQRAIGQREIFQEEFRVTHPNGEERWLCGRGQGLTDTHDRVVRLIGVNFEITESKRVEQTLLAINQQIEAAAIERSKEWREQHERLQAVLDNAFDAMIGIDRHGMIETVNPAASRMFGYTAAEMIGQNIKLLMPSPYHEEHDGYLRRYLETGQARVIGIGREVAGRRKDGSTFPLDLAVSEVDHMRCFIGILRDISERKSLQRQILAVAESEQRRIGQELHDGIAQELTGLSLFARSLRATLGTLETMSNEQWQHWLQDKAGLQKLQAIAAQVSEGLTQCNRHVQELSRGMMPAQIDAAGLPSALQHLTDTIQASGTFSCQFECAELLPPCDQTTASHVYRIAQEAVNNAVKHSRGNRIRIFLGSSGGHLLLEVVDNGVGLDVAPATVHELSGAGLRGMQYRASLIGAMLHVGKHPEGGTIVSCLVMHDARANAPADTVTDPER